jgi:GDP-4-dehydro-6-deoxy-D-mannose reductase
MKYGSILITGINGFVGQHMAKFLYSEGIRVFGIGRSPKCSHENQNIQYRSCDLLNQTDVESLFDDMSFDYIIHLAAENDVQRSWSYPQKVFQTNISGTFNLLEAIRRKQLNTLKKMLVIGSAHVYDFNNTHNKAISENTPLSPNSPYGWSKLFQTQLSSSYADLFSIPIIIARTFNLIGPGATGGVCAQLVKQIVEIEQGHRPPEITLSNANISRDFIDVRDAVRAYWSLLHLKNFQLGDSFNICKGETYPLKRIFTLLKKHSKAPITLQQGTFLSRRNEPLQVLGDNRKLRSVSNWVPIYSLEQSLYDMLCNLR